MSKAYSDASTLTMVPAVTIFGHAEHPAVGVTHPAAPDQARANEEQPPSVSRLKTSASSTASECPTRRKVTKAMMTGLHSGLAVSPDGDRRHNC